MIRLINHSQNLPLSLGHDSARTKPPYALCAFVGKRQFAVICAPASNNATWWPRWNRPCPAMMHAHCHHSATRDWCSSAPPPASSQSIRLMGFEKVGMVRMPPPICRNGCVRQADIGKTTKGMKRYTGIFGLEYTAAAECTP